MSRTYVALDTETTGLNPERDEIIEIGAVRFRDGQVIDTWSTLVHPRQRLPYKIQLLTGIQPEELEHAPPISALSGPLTQFLGNSTIVGHNVRFDLTFLRQHGIPVTNVALDTFELASILVPGATSYSLEDLTQTLGIEVETHHRALSDAIACKDLFIALFQRGLDMDLSVLQEINRVAAQSHWPAQHFFLEMERERARTAFTGAVREQLRAKGEIDADSMGLVWGREQRFEPLRPSASKVFLDEERLAAMLKPGGDFAASFPGYEHRPQQIDMMRAVTQAFNEGDQLLAEAGTGTGKSVAYLVPAIHFAIDNGQPVVVSTNTINLQDQLFNKDIPDLRKVLGIEFRAALLKGRSNYLCLRRFRAFRRSQSMDVNEVQVLAKILAWLPVTATGDIAELSLRNEEQPVWRKVQAERETCLGDRCPHFRQGRCFFYRARHQAEAAHIIVINHALLLSDMMVDNRVLPEYHHLIVDEAHHLEARATEQLGFGLNRVQGHALLGSISHALPTGQYRGLLAQIPQHLHGSSVSTGVRDQVSRYLSQLQQQVDQAHHSSEAFFERLQEFVSHNVLPDVAQSNNAYDIRIELTEGIRHQPDWSDVEILADDLCSDLQVLEKGLHHLHAGLSDLEDQKILDYDDLVQEVWAAFERVQQLRQQLQAIVIDLDSAGVRWLAIGANDQEVSLNSAPLHVGPILRRNLFPKLETLVMTSATLRTGSDFHYIRERLDLRDADELMVGSPFDYGSSTLLLLPTDIPEPGQPNYQNVVSRTAIDLCLATEGRALLLFTSYSQLRATYRALSGPLEEAGIVVYGQGLDGSRRQLLERFKSNPRSVLLGTRSFWEGIDVVGPALSCLVIARLPFAVPTDPVFAARSRAFDDPFVEYAVPEAVLRFRQGFGRLIRSTKDRGVVVVLDRRLMTKRYGSSFLDSLPDCTEYRGPIGDLPAMAAGWIAGSTVEGTALMSEGRWRRSDEDWW
jgi:DNA polymerase-3 subunit epsilon/ATP-dependent DNA helicase DinG